jgi:hypothetical protein
MAAKIVAETWNADATKWETHAAFDNFDMFLKYASEFKASPGKERLRVHIPGGFHLDPVDKDNLKKLGVDHF